MHPNLASLASYSLSLSEIWGGYLLCQCNLRDVHFHAFFSLESIDLSDTSAWAAENHFTRACLNKLSSAFMLSGFSGQPTWPGWISVPEGILPPCTDPFCSTTWQGSRWGLEMGRGLGTDPRTLPSPGIHLLRKSCLSKPIIPQPVIPENCQEPQAS